MILLALDRRCSRCVYNILDIDHNPILSLYNPNMKYCLYNVWESRMLAYKVEHKLFETKKIESNWK